MAAPPTVAARAVGGDDRGALGASVAALADALLSSTPTDAEAAEEECWRLPAMNAPSLPQSRPRWACPWAQRPLSSQARGRWPRS